MAKYKKCPRCELNYILEGEDYCYVCKSEMKHHNENEESDLLDIEDMELCPICGQNYITEDQAMCDECSGKGTSKKSENGKDWKDGDLEESLTESSDDVDGDDDEDEKYNSGFSDIDVSEEDDPFKTDDDIVDDDPLVFASEEDIEETFDEEHPSVDDFETIDVLDDDEDDDDDDDDDYDFGDDDLLGKKK